MWCEILLRPVVNEWAETEQACTFKEKRSSLNQLIHWHEIWNNLFISFILSRVHTKARKYTTDFLVIINCSVSFADRRWYHSRVFHNHCSYCYCVVLFMPFILFYFFFAGLNIFLQISILLCIKRDSSSWNTRLKYYQQRKMQSNQSKTSCLDDS